VLDARDAAPENLPQIMREYEPETINGQISRILLLVETLRNAGATTIGDHIRLLQFFGELFTPLHRKLLRNFFRNATLQGGYASSETATSTTECPATTENRYHLFKDSPTVFSIAEPDEQGIGEIIATTHELEGYRTGDLGKLDPIPCPCGESPTLVLYGRKDFDIVPVLGATFLKSELERALEPYLDRLDDYQLRVGDLLLDEKLIGRAEFDFSIRENAEISDQEISEHLARTLFVTKTRTLADIVKAGIFIPLIVRRVAEIKRGSKKIHLKRADFSEVRGT
jgi:phenylacetate-coenzyme A ligase PaaK-like adenylate-forming protein